MMQRLELTWIGKGEDPAVEPRVLLHDPSKDYGDPNTENMLIHGDNLLALKALEQQYAGQVKCIYIDPPYNTGAAFEHYDDNLEHSIWLQLMKTRLNILKNLLADDGSIWISIDDHEQAYLQILCDEVFGRACHVQTVIWRSSDNSNNDSKQFSQDHNYILVYSKTPNWQPKKLQRTEEQSKHYSNPDNDPRGPWFDGNPLGSPNPRPNLTYNIIAPNGNIIKPPFNGWRWSEDTLKEKMETGEIRFNSDYTAIKRRTYLNEQKGLPASSLWADLDETGHTRQAKYEQKKLFPEMNKNTWFATPKPERLIQRVLTLATDDNDLVLDSFLGSGTTAAVAQKMDRRYIGIELGDHCYTHCIPRLQKVIDGEQGGISKSVNWQGGGGYKFYELAPTLLEKDKHGNHVFSDKYNAEMLVAAVAKINGFYYAPDSDNFWKQGFSQDNSYIYVTTQYLTAAILDGIAVELSPMANLLICSPAFDIGLGKRYDNINVRKIPQSVLKKCEFGVDNYNLNIVDIPELDEEEWEDD
jgi:adenine-specific DNA-methyltransferase